MQNLYIFKYFEINNSIKCRWWKNNISKFKTNCIYLSLTLILPQIKKYINAKMSKFVFLYNITKHNTLINYVDFDGRFLFIVETCICYMAHCHNTLTFRKLKLINEWPTNSYKKNCLQYLKWLVRKNIILL